MVRSVYRQTGAAALLLVLITIPSAASANQIDFRRVGHGSAVSISGVRSGSFMAGELEWQWIGTTPDGFAQSFYSYCADVSQNLADPQTVTARSSDGFTNGVSDGGGKAAWLFNTYAADIRAIVARIGEPSTLLLMGVAFLMLAKRSRKTPISPAQQ